MKQLILLLIWFPVVVTAQITDDFSDGDFTQNPVWTGTSANFVVNTALQLQLNDTSAGVSWLSTANSKALNCEWRFWVKQSFSPSANNYGRVYLISNNQNLSQPLQGYFIQLGESGSSDAVELFRQDGQTAASVCRGTEGLIASSFHFGVKVIRSATGHWDILIDRDNNGTYVAEASGEDATWQTTSFFGFYTKYTSSNADNFYWDNIYAGEVIVDTLPPQVESVTAISDSSLAVIFNEPVKESTVLTLENYNVNQGIGVPKEVAVQGVTVTLVFQKKFQNGSSYLLTVKNIQDLAGNVIMSSDVGFSWYQAVMFDVVFNEIYPDPSPSIGLPAYEYLELYNRTGAAISLDGWKLITGTSEKDFQNISIKPGGYLILAKSTAAHDFANFGDFYGFSSFSLPNSGQTLVLKNRSGQIISRVSYTKSWYHNADKAEGGWSIEQINPDNVCSGIDNWRASESSYGGTPGEKNSVFNAVVLLPDIDHFELMGTDILRIWFNQAMDAAVVENTTLYTVDNGVGSPSAVYTDAADPQKAELYFSTPFTTGLLYHLQIDKAVSNCAGNHPEKPLLFSFGIPENIKPFDVVINEILFNPLGDGVDYVELYNRSEKVIDLSRCKLGSVRISPPNPPDTTFYAVAQEQLLFMPSGYLVLTKSPEKVQEQYFTANADAFRQVNPFPSYNNDGGTAILSTADDTIIDAFTYNESMQYPLLNYVDGVALERINPKALTNDPNNWHSAAESVGFGTPGYKNSQWINPDEPDDEIAVEPEIFSPDNDGIDDVINISYRFNKPGYNIKILIYDQNGRIVKHLIDNELSGTSGSISWDGITDDNTKAQVGIYIFYIRVFDLDGNIKSWKKTGVLGTKW